MTVFVSYSHADEQWKDKIVRHLRVLELQGELDLWDDRRIAPGENWADDIREALESARVALLLVSANSLTSEFILNEEIPALLRSRASEGLRLIPVIVRPSAWEEIPWLASIQAFPRDGRPLSTMEEHEVDAELTTLAREVRRAMPDAARSGSGTASPPTVPPLVAPPKAAPPLERQEVDPLDRYELMKVIQVGRYSRVLKCVLRDTGETCIVKETAVERVSERALAALAGISCPNIASPQRIWRTVDKVYEQLPYVGGISLQQAVAPRLGGLDGGMLESFHGQVRRVLETLHAAGIVHRDIHPANIYLVLKRPSELAERGETDPQSAWIFEAFGEHEDAFLVAWVVVDLTFAILAGEADQEAYRHGPYTPEEQQDAVATAASDMYALGATMFFGVFGTDPPSPLDRRVNPRTESELTEAVGLSPLKRYLRLMALDAAERPAAAHQLREESVAAGLCGVLRLGDDQYALVDMFPVFTRVVSRRDALRELRRLQRSWGAESGQWLTPWIDWLSAQPTPSPLGAEG